MKLSNFREEGSVLLVTLALTVILGSALASYLTLVQYQNKSVIRSQYWNAAIPACEAGIEEALTQMNTVGDGDRGVNGWTLSNGSYTIARSVGSNSRYEVAMDSFSQPSITSIGYVKEPISGVEIKRTVKVTTTRYGAGMRGIVARKYITMNGNTRIDSFDSDNPALSTNGRYDSTKAHDQGYAGAVSGNISADGDGIWGYVATGPNGTVTGNVGDSTWMAGHTGVQGGHYTKDLNVSFPDVTVPFSGGASSPLVNQSMTTTNYTFLSSQASSLTYPSPDPGNVTTNWQTFTATTKPATWSGVLVTNTSQVVNAATYPADGTYVGNVTTITTTKNKKTTTTYTYTAITGYTYTAAVYTYNTTTTNTTTQTTTYAYVTDSGNYQMNSLSISGQNELLVRGNTVLYIAGDFSMTGQSQITILPGASLTIYVGGSASLAGNGVMNLNQDATKYSLYGLPTCTSISLSGNAAFTGTIYAPTADLALNGSGNTVYDCVGAVVCNTAYFHGNFQFHYDEKLGRTAIKSQFRIASWNEI